MAESLSDATLLERFVSDREEAAFVTLVRRHGPRVERICRRILQNEHDVEDVLQATFLVLVAQGGRDLLARVGESLARRRRAAAGHACKVGRGPAAGPRDDGHGPGWAVGPSTMARLPERYHPLVEPSAEVERRDVRRVIDDELLRLPEKYRAPVVLCDLEGHTREEAARRLGWPTGSMSRRLDRARTLLRRRLTHRGLAIAIRHRGGLDRDRRRRARPRARPIPASLGDVRQVMSPVPGRSRKEARAMVPSWRRPPGAEGSRPRFRTASSPPPARRSRPPAGWNGARPTRAMPPSGTGSPGT